ncbi:glycosyltransferase [Pontibacter sp. E15-1]|uniref:glycosyltransferase n=1 Tax=Pontibacter sp. E15-1 TaxID=2919918 RepID=UPI001F4FF7E1|nr:glycosyltransferase [Pontibacter sp. E15-1]MCJ8166344.1 glycosyltransferase [Pontibacter sp. E15-1]
MGLKPEVLVFIDWYLPGYKAGGPIKSVANIVGSLNHEVSFNIVTSDTDFGEAAPYAQVRPNVWENKGVYRVIYLDAEHQKVGFIKQLLQEKRYDLIYFNSLFSFKFTLLPLYLLKFSSTASHIVVAPRGMLGKGALQLKKRKKQIFLSVAKGLGLFKEVTWHASTEMEAAEIRSMFGKNAAVKVATNIASLALGKISSTRVKTPENTAFFFLSRISQKKNLLNALILLSKISVCNAFKFHIIGPVEDERYWQQCQEVIAALPPHIQVVYEGAIPNPELPALLQQYHFLFLPTFSENYGHVVVEAWANGCPVILSDQTPWQSLETEGVGWDIALSDEQRFLEVLAHCIKMTDNEYAKMSQKTQIYMNQRVVTDDIIQQNRRLFLQQ